MSHCVSGKICHDTKEMAEEALIENRIKFNHPVGSGPINIYLCQDCNYYHFTSKGAENLILKEKADYIKKQQEARSWENKLRY